MGWILDQLGKEKALISGAPLTFAFTWTLGLIVIWWVLDKWVYRERLTAKDDLITTYKNKLAEAQVATVKRDRALTAQQRAMIIGHVSRHIGHEKRLSRFFEVFAMPGCEQYAWDIMRAFQEAGLGAPQTVQSAPGFMAAKGYEYGVWIVGRDGQTPPTDDLVAAALELAKITFHRAETEIEGVNLVVGKDD